MHIPITEEKPQAYVILMYYVSTTWAKSRPSLAEVGQIRRNATARDSRHAPVAHHSSDQSRHRHTQRQRHNNGQ